MLVTLASLAGPHVQVPSLRHVVLVGPEFAEAIARQPTDRLVSGRAIQPDDLSSFCTGGTTGTPKIAMRTHANEVANAWSVGQVFGEAIGAGKTLSAGCRCST